MSKIVVRLPEPRKVYTEDNQRQINRSIASVIEQLNSTYQQPEKTIRKGIISFYHNV